MERIDTKGKILYQKIGGGSLRLSNRIIKPNQRFWEFPENIPTAFKDTLIELNTSNVIKEEEKEIVSEKKKYYKKSRGGGWYDIFDENEKKINEKALKKLEADEMLKEL